MALGLNFPGLASLFRRAQLIALGRYGIDIGEGGGLRFDPPPPGPPPPPRPPGAPVRGGGPGRSRSRPAAPPYVAPPPPGFYGPGWARFMECATRAGRESVRRGRSTDGEIAEAIFAACGARPPGLIPDEFDDPVIPKVPTSQRRALLGPILQRAIPVIIRALPRIGAPVVIPAPPLEPELEPLPRGPTRRPRITPPTDLPELYPIPVDVPRIIPPDFFPAPVMPEVRPRGPRTRPTVRPLPRPLEVPAPYALPAPRPLPVPTSKSLPVPTPRPTPFPRPTGFPWPLALPFLPLAFPFGAPGGLSFPQPQPTPPRPEPRPPPRGRPLTPQLPGDLPFAQPLGFRTPDGRCVCTKEKPRRKKRKLRAECREGTYRETARGTLKRPRRKIPCR